MQFKILWSEVTQSCLTLWDPMDCSLPRSSVHGIFQAGVLEWVAISFSRGSSQPRDLNLGLPHCRQMLYHLSHQGSLKFSKGHIRKETVVLMLLFCGCCCSITKLCLTLSDLIKLQHAKFPWPPLSPGVCSWCSPNMCYFFSPIYAKYYFSMLSYMYTHIVHI